MQELLAVRGTSAESILTILKSVATDNGSLKLHEIHRKTLSAVATNMFDETVDIDALPTAFGRAINDVDPALFSEVIHLAAIFPLLEDEFKTERASALNTLAQRWKTEVSLTKAIAGFLEDHKTRMFLHALRSSTVELGSSALAQSWGLLKAKLHLDGDAKTHARFERYRDLPEGTFGRTMIDYYTDNEFAIPGLPGNYFSNQLIKHDYHHVLSGYDTSPIGELSVLMFDDGVSKEDYSTAIIGLIAQIQIASIFDSSIPGWVDQFDPDVALRAKRRGMDCKVNYLDDPNFDFESLMDRQLSDIRAEFGISEEGMLVSSKEHKWCGPLGVPYKRESDQLVKPATLNLS